MLPPSPASITVTRRPPTKIYASKLRNFSEDDPDQVAAVLPAALAEVDTPIVRAGLVRAVQALHDAGRVSGEVAAAVAVEQASHSTTLLRASLLEAVAVSVGPARTPAGLLVVSHS
jgi:hypothetical protein